jgi:hypothetical protein
VHDETPGTKIPTSWRNSLRQRVSIVFLQPNRIVVCTLFHN